MADPDYFTLAEFRQLPDCGEFSDAEILAAAAFFTAIVERECGQPLIPRTYTETLDGRGTPQLVLAQPNVRTLTSVTVGGTTVDTASLGFTGGVLRYLTATSDYATGYPWVAGVGNVVVTYTAGKYATCPADIKDAVMWATRDRLLSQSDASGSWDRKTSETSEFGTVQYALPGEKRPTGYPELDALIASYVRNTASLGFA